jgi:hypothetical protein
MSLPGEPGPPAPESAGAPETIASPEVSEAKEPVREDSAVVPGDVPPAPAPTSAEPAAAEDAASAALGETSAAESAPAVLGVTTPAESAPAGLGETTVVRSAEQPEQRFAASKAGMAPRTAPLTAVQDQPDLPHVTDAGLPALFRDRTGEPALILDGKTHHGPRPPASPGQRYADHPAFNRSGRAKSLVTTAAVAVLVVGGGVIAWAATQHSGPARPATAAHAASAPVRLPSPTQAATRAPSPTPPAPTATPPPGSGGMVVVTPAVLQDGDEPEVLAFLDEYFAAINSHDYQQYRSLLDGRLRQGETAAEFRDGYWSTTDTGAKLVRLAPAAAQGLAATITFTSHQAASDSPTQTACTDWRTTLYLSPLAESYVIQPPPPHYRAKYHSC